MLNNERETLFIGIDVGNGNTKTSHLVFGSGVKEHSIMPPITTGVVENCSGIYSVGHPKNTIPTKKLDKNMLPLIEAAVAEELKLRGLTTANLYLGLGVPLTRMAKDKSSLEFFFEDRKYLSFKYDGVTYNTKILGVEIYPQGYAGILNYISNLDRLSLVIDIGSWTVDILPLRDGRPDVSECKSLQFGTIPCMHKINEALRAEFDGEADEVFLKDVMITGTCNELPANYLSVIRRELYSYVEDLLGQLRAMKINLDTTQLVFIGGGATIIKHFLDSKKYPKATVIDDVHINAKGYESLIRHKYGNGGK